MVQQPLVLAVNKRLFAKTVRTIPERSKGREKTLPAAHVESSIALDFTTPIREALTTDQSGRKMASPWGTRLLLPNTSIELQRMH